MISHEIITRKEAIGLGLAYYFTGKPCKNGHIAKRRVTHKGCFECRKIRTKAYHKANPEKIKQLHKKSRTRDESPRKKVNKLWRDNNKEYIKEHDRQRAIEKRAYERALKCAEQDQETE